MDLKDLVTYSLNAPRGVILALVNSNDRKVYLTHITNLFDFLARINRDGEVKGLPSDQLTLCQAVILEEGVYEAPGIRLSYWVDYYKDQGYTFYNKTRESRYQVKYKLNADNATVTMYLSNKNKRSRIVVGSFVSLAEAKLFEQVHYGKVYRLVRKDE